MLSYSPPLAAKAPSLIEDETFFCTIALPGLSSVFK